MNRNRGYVEGQSVYRERSDLTTDLASNLWGVNGSERPRTEEEANEVQRDENRLPVAPVVVDAHARQGEREG